MATTSAPASPELPAELIAWPPEWRSEFARLAQELADAGVERSSGTAEKQLRDRFRRGLPPQPELPPELAAVFMRHIERGRQLPLLPVANDPPRRASTTAGAAGRTRSRRR